MIVGSRAIAGSMFYKLSACPHRATAAPFTNLADRVEINPQKRVTCSTDKDRRGGCHASQSICGAGFRKNAEWGSITSPSYRRIVKCRAARKTGRRSSTPRQKSAIG